VADEIVERLGARDAAKLAALLRAVADLYGGMDTIAARRLRPVQPL
jgi:hypothetical protein